MGLDCYFYSCNDCEYKAKARQSNKGTILNGQTFPLGEPV